MEISQTLLFLSGHIWVSLSPDKYTSHLTWSTLQFIWLLLHYWHVICDHHNLLITPSILIFVFWSLSNLTTSHMFWSFFLITWHVPIYNSSYYTDTCHTCRWNLFSLLGKFAGRAIYFADVFSLFFNFYNRRISRPCSSEPNGPIFTKISGLADGCKGLFTSLSLFFRDTTNSV